MKRLKLGVMASGRGSNLQAIIDNIESGRLPAEIVVLVCNRAGATALERARQHGIRAAVFELAAYASRHARDEAMADCLVQHDIDLVVMAGYDQLVSDDLLIRFAGRIINIHPSLLPAFAGSLHAQRDAWEYGAKVAGCTVHFVTPGPADGGPIILQKAIPVLEDDTPDSLADRILAEEHKLFSEGIRLLAEGKVEVVGGRRVRIK